MKQRILSLALAVILGVSMWVTAIAAESSTTEVETEKVKITSDFDGDGKSDWTWTLPGVIKTEKMMMGDETQLDTKENSDMLPLVDKEVTVYTVKAGTKIATAVSFYDNCKNTHDAGLSANGPPFRNT